VCLPLLIFPWTIKSRSFLAPAHLGGPRKRAIKRLWCDGGGGGGVTVYSTVAYSSVKNKDIEGRTSLSFRVQYMLHI